MDSKENILQTQELFSQLFAQLINLKQPLVKLADAIDWPVIEKVFLKT